MMAKTKSIQRPINFALYILVALIISALPARAWNNVGHRAIAELAWRQMSLSQRQAVSDLLKQHPHYRQLLAVNIPAGVDTNEWVFLCAAVWPDWVRPAKKDQPRKPHSVTKYDLYPHAIGYPFLRTGDTNHALLENFFIAKPNAEMVLSNSIATLNNQKASAHDRAVSLCWVLHLFGDLHQPLHAANRVTKKRPRGEGLGGDHYVLDSHGKRINLHSFWDQLPGLDSSYAGVAALADEIQAAPDLQPLALKEYQDHKTIASWVQESFRVAVDFAYSEDRVQFVHADALESGKTTLSAIPTLKADYVADARKIAHRRLALAALRLADVLKQVW